MGPIAAPARLGAWRSTSSVLLWPGLTVSAPAAKIVCGAWREPIGRASFPGPQSRSDSWELRPPSFPAPSSRGCYSPETFGPRWDLSFLSLYSIKDTPDGLAWEGPAVGLCGEGQAGRSVSWNRPPAESGWQTEPPRSPGHRPQGGLFLGRDGCGLLLPQAWSPGV